MTQGDAQDEIDARFREIIAEFENDLDADAAPEPIAEPPSPQPLVIPAQWRIPAADQPHILDEESEFVPPDPAPLPKDDPQFWAILICLIGGPLWLGYLYFFDRYTSRMWWVLAAGMAVAGLVLLFARQPANRDEDDPYDDGAVL